MMKQMTIVLLTLVIAMGMPMIAAAMSHENHADSSKKMTEDMKQHSDMDMDHAKEMSTDMHKGHDMAGQDDDFLEIGKDTQEGVVATVKVKTYDEKTMASMAKMGMDATHHVMVFFADEKSGNDIAGGQVALKVKGKEAKPVMMMQMGTGFGADVSLEEGMHTFEVGTKLEDGKKRQFSVMFHNM
ncbi:MAG: hypothetical protein IH613_01105 [Desulfuromonadales bacterium]|nr:hypothetical protein [Desulfuromonadales bacterium]